MSGISDFCSKISQRWVTVILEFIIFLNMYGMRNCLSIAITEMALPPNNTNVFSNDTCSQNYDNTNNTYNKHPESLNKNRYDWSERTQGLILSSFYLGFILTNIVGGMINQKFGSRNTLSLSILCASAFTLVTPYCITRGGSTGLIILRLAIGLTEGLVQPALICLLAHWVPKNERSKAGLILYSAVPLGAIFGVLPSGVILKHSDTGWPMVFYFFGTAGLVTFLLNFTFCYNSPSDSPFISDKELNYLKNAIKNTHSNLPFAPWRYILKSLPVWSLIIATAGQMYGVVINSTDMPKYMSAVLKMSVQKNGYLSSVPHLSMLIAGSVFSWIADKFITKKIISITSVRKIGCAVSLIGTAIFLIAASYAGCDGTVVTILMSVGFSFMSGVFFSTSINPVDLSPNFASTVAGLMHGVATGITVFAPYGVGMMTPNQTLKEWRLAFWVAFGIMVTSSVPFLIYASAEVQEWNDPAFLNRKRSVNENGVKESVDLLPVT